ncbi:DUF5343 domain-containing protein [Leifsonia sp. 1010]|uniref:DUF5343 domain-containing protein n=1 Tax=Leifsonia sp. 1010 TaxID=2817769 RepID=UPI00285705A4|nr:DUF5343 domain-containing protein [Leifsonia sp. 1010]MDR6613089.1 hypothetical protein [Leifsonia sp. 1010]
MTDTATSTKGYPYVSANVWSELRLRFQKSVPAKVTPSYLQSALGFNTEKAARNLIPQLKTIGLIDAEGVPTDLAKRFRIDTEYAAAAQEIVQNVYPEELRDLYPGPSENAADVTAWFMRHTGGGQASAGIQARFYLSLVSRNLPSTERQAKAANGDGPTPKRAQRKTAAEKPKRKDETNSADASIQANPGAGAESKQGAPQTKLPNLHVDVQVHISADASTEQIDAVFASMAKHLYGTK